MHEKSDRLVARDMERILICLREKPMSCLEIAFTLRLTRSRIRSLLKLLADQQCIHAPTVTVESNTEPLNNLIFLWGTKQTEPDQPESDLSEPVNLS